MAWLGALLGALFTLLWFAPASWLAAALLQLSQGRVELAAPQGTVWSGSARLQLSGGAGSHDASALPGRMSWRLRPEGLGLRAQVNADCCTPQGLTLHAQARIGGFVLGVDDAASNWPAALLSGLGTPWNTLRPEGDLLLQSQGLRVEMLQGRVALAGSATIDARDMSSRLSTLRPLGSYRLALQGGAVTTLKLQTLEGSLQLNGDGEWSATRLHFVGTASAAPERQAALANLLNIIGRRNGDRSIISVG